MRVSYRFSVLFMLNSVLMACITEPNVKGIMSVAASWTLMYLAYKAGLDK